MKSSSATGRNVCGSSALSRAKDTLQKSTAWNGEYFGDESTEQEGKLSNVADDYVGEHFELAEDWVEELHKTEGRIKELDEGWVEEFEKKAVFEGESEWTQEFNETAEDQWVIEFRHNNADIFPITEEAEEDPDKLAESAAALLATLDGERDEKLRNSQFVAYLRRLANREPRDLIPGDSITHSQVAFNEWREEFRRNIDSLVSDEDRVWEENWIKDWQKYDAEGIGYEGFAAREYRRYQFNSDNSYQHLSEDEIRHQITRSNSLRDQILMTEALLQIHPSAQSWSSLGNLQSDNEMDVQAIAAHQEALSLDRNLLDSWIGLSLACINERCISDAYEAMENWLRLHPFYRQIPVNVQSVNRNSELLRCFLSLISGESAGSDSDVLLLTSVLQNLDGQQSAALTTLNQAVDRAAPEVQRQLHNRLGAMLANSGRYEEALAHYHSALRSGMSTPRLRYNMGVSLMSMGRHSEAQQEFIQALQLQLPVTVTNSLRPDLRDAYRCIWTTLSLLCELQGQIDLRMQAELGNLNAFSGGIREL